jgi:hypothetical protein
MTGEQWMRGTVKTVFILCYIAFMAASIRHVATFFNGFEPNNDNTVGSYALAGAFDITALVTTIGVMFFRKSMPTWVLVIVWAFILAIAGYSFFLNWEYASHYQDMSMLMQPTGATTPVYDAHGALHYVPTMQLNTGLIWVNPILASGFTIFSLVYSVVAEFFGTKPPTIDELATKLADMEARSPLVEQMNQLAAKNKKPSVLARAKDAAKELKEVVDTFGKSEQQTPSLEAQIEPQTNTKEARITGPLSGVSGEYRQEFHTDEIAVIQPANRSVSAGVSGASNASYLPAFQPGQIDVIAAIEMLSKYYPKIVAWRSIHGKSVPIKQVIEVSGIHHRTVYALVHRGVLTKVNRAPDKVLLTSVIEWLINEVSKGANTAQKADLISLLSVPLEQAR